MKSVNFFSCEWVVICGITGFDIVSTKRLRFELGFYFLVFDLLKQYKSADFYLNLVNRPVSFLLKLYFNLSMGG